MGQLLLEGDGLLLRQRVHVVPQIFRELGDGLLAPAGVAAVSVPDGAQRIVEEVGLDLAEHDLHMLPVQQLPFMVALEAQMQPDVIEDAAADQSDGKGRKRKYPVSRRNVKEHRRRDEQIAEQRQPEVASPAFPVFPDRQPDQVDEKHRADIKAG